MSVPIDDRPPESDDQDQAIEPDDYDGSEDAEEDESVVPPEDENGS